MERPPRDTRYAEAMAALCVFALVLFGLGAAAWAFVRAILERAP